MSVNSAAAWVKFFSNAGIPSQAAATYAHVFYENRIQTDMLADLNKEYLREMGITMMGDIIAILRHAKNVQEQNVRERVLSTPSGEPKVPVAAVAASLPSAIGSCSISRTISLPHKPQARRVLPEHEGKYKVTLPTGTTSRSKEILTKLKSKQKKGIFDRFANLDNDDDDDDVLITEPTVKRDVRLSSIIRSSTKATNASIFSRLGGKKADSPTESFGILKNAPVSNVKKVPQRQQKVILVKKIPAKAVAIDSDDDYEDDYERMDVGEPIKAVSFSEEDEVVVIAPRPRPKPQNKLRSMTKDVNVKMRLGLNESRPLHDTKKVVKMKPLSVKPMLQTKMKSDAIMRRQKSPIQNRLSLESVKSTPTQLTNRLQRFSLDSKMDKARARKPQSKSVFNRLGFNKK